MNKETRSQFETSGPIHTSCLLFLGDLDDMQVLVALESGSKELNRLVTLYLLILSIQATLLVTIGVICPLHEIKALLILTLDLELELELVEHALNLGGCVRCVCLDEIYQRDKKSEQKTGCLLTEVCILLGPWHLVIYRAGGVWVVCVERWGR
jgi:hypothetical protein